MRAFDYVRAEDMPTALREGGQPDTRFLAGGTTLLDLMKCGVEQPARIVDITRVTGLNAIEVDQGSIRIGGLAKMSHVAADARVKAAAPAVSEALWRAASPQLRNMATIGGNLMQRTRCSYFRDPLAYANCNKRDPGSGCAAMAGVNRNHAVLGTSEACIAIYPGDLGVSLVAFDAKIHIQGARTRVISAGEFFRLPGDRPDIDNDLAPGEIIVGIEVPVSAALKRSHYLKVRDRSSYEFAAASAAVGLELEPDATTIREARVALGGVATKPWRVRAVERALVGKPLRESVLREAAALATEGARSREHNAFKIALTPKVVARALMVAGGIA
ncbi:xanthine dehydrogenase family protein subunit M [Mycolicibacterium sp. P9-22]|uniref:FAD binding domain-containing protein n=1 Tax=Mycolicibacterium sp. P9-22 TaxID=2024613 RepID=UPI0011EC4EFE|nr:xanthine dehydrogenase family protein subunit M [Mycolicibacterium sp. P9-22]KAA0113968.1 xanthine dehydrogenase family protein subunit M [Mycolicibacterium sp. P9-22]